MSTPDALPLDLAQRLCKEVQAHQPLKLFTQCWGCTTFSKGEIAKMCGGITACNLVLSRYDKLKAKGEI